MRTRLFVVSISLVASASSAQLSIPTDTCVATDFVGLGDVNMDGIGDVAVGEVSAMNGGMQTGRVFVVSGADGAQIWEAFGAADGDAFGHALDAVGDLNADGIRDVLVGAIQDSCGTTGAGYAQVLSGADGSVIYTVSGGAPADALGWSVTCIGDVDGDTLDEFAVSAFTWPFGPGYVRLYSGSDASQLRHFDPGGLLEFGFDIDGPGDVDGDTLPDILIAAPGNDSFANIFPSVQVRSCLDGSVLHTSDNGDIFGDYGHSVSGIGDIDLDGRADFLVGDPSLSGCGTGIQVSLWTGLAATSGGSAIPIPNPSHPCAEWGRSVAGLGDVTGDGIDDFAVPLNWSGTEVIVYSGADLSIYNSVQLPAERIRRIGDITGDGLEDVGFTRLCGFVTCLPSANRVVHVVPGDFDCGVASTVERNSGSNPSALTGSSFWVGRSASLNLFFHVTGHPMGVVLAYATPLTFTLPGGQTLLVNVADPGGELLALPLFFDPFFGMSVDVPHDVTLCGFEFSCQGVLFGGGQPFALTNALDVVVGPFDM